MQFLRRLTDGNFEVVRCGQSLGVIINAHLSALCCRRLCSLSVARKVAARARRHRPFPMEGIYMWLRARAIRATIRRSVERHRRI